MQAQSSTLDRNGSLNLPAREGDIVVFGQPPRERHRLRSLERAGHRHRRLTPSAEIALGRLTLVPGLRFEPVLIDGSPRSPRRRHHAAASATPLLAAGKPGRRVSSNRYVGALRYLPNPRLAAAFRATRRLTLTAGGGIYGQPPDPEDMSPVFGNPTLDMSRAVHVSGGFSYKLRPTLTLEIVGFYKRLLRSGVAQREPVAAGGAGADPGRHRPRLRRPGAAAAGAAARLLRLDHLLADRAASGAITRTRDWRLFDFDQTHVLGVLASYQLRPRLGGRQRAFATRPAFRARRSSAPGVFDNRNDQYEPNFGAHNSIRIPAFYQLDARLETLVRLRGAKLNVFLDVQNVTNRKNPEEIIYNYNFTTKRYITGLPTLAVLGARVEF